MKNVLQIRAVYADHVNLQAWIPDSLEAINIKITIEIGIKGEVGTNNFYFTLTTPESLRSRADEKYFILENRTIVVGYFDFKFLIKGLNSMVESCQSSSFEESCILLTRYFHWEYEDYH